jgi:xyloglucan-specific exo-beta-1,4-glucanase
VAGVEAASAVGFGQAAPGKTYPAVYVAGSIQRSAGIHRSDDAGATFQRIDDPEHQFGWISQISGDRRVYGRAYLGSGGRGILYGDPAAPFRGPPPSFP